MAGVCVFRPDGVWEWLESCSPGAHDTFMQPSVLIQIFETGLYVISYSPWVRYYPGVFKLR